MLRYSEAIGEVDRRVKTFGKEEEAFGRQSGTPGQRMERRPVALSNQPLQRNAGNRPFCGSALSSAWLI